MRADFPRSLRLVLTDEGGLDDDPHDHGGRTAHGVIQREYDGYRRRKGLPLRDVWKIEPHELTEIYHDQYWEPWCDQLTGGVDYVYFDDKVNTGPVQATRTLQRVLGVRVDGHMGEVTISAIQAADPNKLIRDYCNARRKFYRGLKQFPRYGRGWLARVDHVQRAAAEIYATGDTERAPLHDDLRQLATARAKSEDVATPPASPEAAGSLMTGSGVAAGFMGNLQDVSSQLSPFQGTFQFVEYVLLGIAVVSAGFMLYGFLHQSRVRSAVA